MDGTLRPDDQRGKEVRRVEHPGAGRLERGTRARGSGEGRSATQARVGQGTVREPAGVRLGGSGDAVRAEKVAIGLASPSRPHHGVGSASTPSRNTRERKTGIEPATPTLARLCSTN